MSPNVLTTDVEQLLTSVFDELSGTLYVTDPDAGTIEALVTALSETDTASVRLLADERVLKDVFDDFIIASTAADLVEAGRLDLGIDDEAANTLVVAPERVVAVVETGSQVAGLSSEDEAFAAAAYDRFEDRWAEAPPYALRTPPISRVRDSLETDLSPETRADFEAVLASLETARGDDDLDEVTLSLLVAAKNEELLYDISKWGEDVGIASKATFSRTKSRLEEMGLIDTQKVPIDVGRPRLRLILGEERLRTVDSDELASVAQSLLAS